VAFLASENMKGGGELFRKQEETPVGGRLFIA
jgi:hypothetical protein